MSNRSACIFSQRRVGGEAETSGLRYRGGTLVRTERLLSVAAILAQATFVCCGSAAQSASPPAPRLDGRRTREGACVAAGHPPDRRGFSSADCLVHERTGQPHYQTFALQGRTRAGACNCSDNYSASGRYPWLEAAWARVQISLFPQPFRQCSAVACGSAVASTSRYPFHCAYRKLHSAFNQRNATLLHPDRLVSAPSVSAS